MDVWTVEAVTTLSDVGLPAALTEPTRATLRLIQCSLHGYSAWVGLRQQGAWTCWTAQTARPDDAPLGLMERAVATTPAGRQRVVHDAGQVGWAISLVAPAGWDAAVVAIGAPSGLAGRDAATSQPPPAQLLVEAAVAMDQTFKAWSLRLRAMSVAQHEARLRAVFNTVLDGIVAFDAEGVIVQANSAMERMFRWPAGGLRGQPVEILFARPEDTPLFAWVHRNALLGSDGSLVGIHRETLGVRRDGTSFPVELCFAFTELDGDAFATATVRDLDAVREVERLKDEFIATVSHELRTPLTSIRGAMGLLLSGKVGAVDERARQFIDIANRNCERLSALVDDILDLEKAEASTSSASWRPVDLGETTDACIELLQTQRKKNHIQIVRVGVPQLAVVYGDARQIGQVLTNLLSNALKFSPAGTRIEVDLTPQNGGWRVAVRDQGGGVPADFVPRLFQRFAQANADKARQVGGTGLGLAIAKTIVERHGGQIGYQPAGGGGGAEFWFWLRALHVG